MFNRAVFQPSTDSYPVRMVKASVIVLLLSASLVSAIYLGKDVFGVCEHSAAYGCLVGTAVVGGILGLYLAYRWMPIVNYACNYIANELDERFDDWIANTKIQNN